MRNIVTPLAMNVQSSQHDQQQQQQQSSLSSTNAPYVLRRDECISKLAGSILFPSLMTVAASSPAIAADPPPMVGEGQVLMYKNPSGLKYVEIREGTGPTPKYGQLCSISYTASLKLPKNDSKKKQFDQDEAFLMRHGNGKMIPGLDEGIHTLKVGGKRRLIIPPKLGYIESGLGPMPAYPWDRQRLNGLLSEMIAQRGGDLIFDVELLSVIDDEASQGYYSDGEPSPAETEFIRTRLMKQSPSAPSEGS